MSAKKTITKCVGDPTYQHQAQNQGRSKSYTPYPDTIPIRKRPVLSANIDQYGVDPYFPAWKRADVNSGTRCSTYGMYLIEGERGPFVNKRMKYAGNTLDRCTVDAMVCGERAWKEQSPCSVNRAKYEHNRKLECRELTGYGRRLRILRLGFRRPIYPPHTPEMEALGLSKDLYQSIVISIDWMHTSMRPNKRCQDIYMIASPVPLRRTLFRDALMKVRDYTRRLNMSQRTIVWTIEKIPWLYDKGSKRNRTEWAFNARNAEDPLELLIQLERRGLIENSMSLGDGD
jgi:hypothetical protein